MGRVNIEKADSHATLFRWNPSDQLIPCSVVSCFDLLSLDSCSIIMRATMRFMFDRESDFNKDCPKEMRLHVRMDIVHNEHILHTRNERHSLRISNHTAKCNFGASWINRLIHVLCDQPPECE